MSQLDMFAEIDEQAPIFEHDKFIAALQKYNKVRYSDIALAKLLNKDVFDDSFYLILLLLKSEQQQHTCLFYEHINWQNPFAFTRNEQTEFESSISPWQSPEQCWQELALHQAVGESKPLRLTNNKLYLARLYDYEKALADTFYAMQQRQIQVDTHALTELLNHYFPDAQGRLDWQKVACAMAAMSGFCVITGGPGTGKTTTVTKLLAVLQSLYSKAPLTVKLVAPTGKAAARLSESMIGAKGRLNLSLELAQHLPEEAQTIHRLLGVIPNSHHFRHNEKNPLHLDLLIVDEASMIDLSLLSKLVQALPKHARLILLGDKDQLASVDTGNVLSDLCDALKLGEQPQYSEQLCHNLNSLCFGEAAYLEGSKQAFALSDNLAFLQQSHRFNENSGIGQLAKAVNNNDQALLNQTISYGYQDLALYELDTLQYQGLIDRAAEQYTHYLSLIHNHASVQEIHAAFSEYQLLAAVKEGPYGVNMLNKKIEQKLANQSLIYPNTRHYLGQPIMISQNDYQLKLFNGDIGIILEDEHQQLKAVFIDEQGVERWIYPNRLPQHNIVYAMTIHKSQGSEFAYTAMLLPPVQRAGVGVNRQLVYTGITRAKGKFELVAQKQVLTQAMARSVQRCSGLRERLTLS